MTKLGIIGAMQEEIETLLHLMEKKTEKEIAGSVFHDGVLEGLPVTVVQCGIGKVNAALCAQILCDLFDVTHLVNTGIAGSLCNDLDIGDMVVSRDAMYHDVDATVFGYPMGKVPQMDVTSFPADDALMAYAFAAAEGVNPGHTKIGRVASGDQFVASREVKERIISITSALCTEMEGAAIAQTAYRNRIPFVILRAISDKADNCIDCFSVIFSYFIFDFDFLSTTYKIMPITIRVIPITSISTFKLFSKSAFDILSSIKLNTPAGIVDNTKYQNIFPSVVFFFFTT